MTNNYTYKFQNIETHPRTFLIFRLHRHVYMYVHTYVYKMLRGYTSTQDNTQRIGQAWN